MGLQLTLEYRADDLQNPNSDDEEEIVIETETLLEASETRGKASKLR